MKGLVILLIAAAVACLVIYEQGAVAREAKKRKPVGPSKLEKTCTIHKKGLHPLFDPDQFARVPCHILDEWLPFKARV
jgi:hypothetical protein